jgi:hypothetical protein
VHNRPKNLPARAGAVQLVQVNDGVPLRVGSKLSRPCHTPSMETYTIIRGGGMYAVLATSEDRLRSVVRASFSSEQVAADYLKMLQQKAEASAPLAPPSRGR